MNRISHRTRALLAVFVLALVSSGCARTDEKPYDIGLRRVALDLAYEDAEKAAPETPKAVEAVVEEAPEPELFVPKKVVHVIPKRAPKFVCGKADPNQTPAVPAFAVVKGPPKMGVYNRHNAGTITAELGTQTVKVPYPPASSWDIRDVKEVTASTYLNPNDVNSLNPPSQVRSNETAFPKRMEFNLTRTVRILGFEFQQIDTLRYSRGGTTGGDYIWLVKRVTISSGVRTEFNPTPPVRLVELFTTEGPDSDVTYVGVDRATKMALEVQSTVVGREWVDVCGVNEDTYKVKISETMVDLNKTPPQTAGSDPAQETFWNIQFDNGLLILREQVHTIWRTSVKTGNAFVPAVVKFDYTSTLDSLEPKPLPPTPPVKK